VSRLLAWLLDGPSKRGETVRGFVRPGIEFVVIGCVMRKRAILCTSCEPADDRWDDGRPFIRTVSTMPAGHTFSGSVMNKGVVAAPPRHRFQICAPSIRACQVPVLKDGM